MIRILGLIFLIGCSSLDANGLTLYPVFDRGTPFICTKGVKAGPGRSHNSKTSKYAVDLQLKGVSDLLSVFSGTVIAVTNCKNRKSSCGSGYGNFVKVLSKSGYIAFYSHLNKVFVRTGQRVKVGQRIGSQGRSGHASGPHTHFSIHHSWINQGMRAHQNSKTLLPKSINYNFNVCADKACTSRSIIKASKLTCRTKRLKIYRF